MAEDPRNKEEQKANLSYEEMMAKRRKEAQEEVEKKLKPEAEEKEVKISSTLTFEDGTTFQRNGSDS